MPINYDVEYPKLQRKCSEKDKRIEELEGWNQGFNTVNEKLLDRAKRAEKQLADMTLACDELHKLHDITIAQLDKVRGIIQQNDDWESSTKETVRNIKQLLSGDLQSEILDIPYDRIDGGELDLYGKGEPKTIDELRISAMIAEIKRLHVFEGYKLVEAFGGDYESPDDFVSASELNVLLEKYDG